MIASPYSRWSEASTRAPKWLAVSYAHAPKVSCLYTPQPQGSTHLETVADSEDGDAGVVNGGVNPRRILLVDRERRARQNDTCVGQTVSICCKGRELLAAPHPWAST